jgi:K+-sensing histidine kinase KdpD
MNAIEAMQSAAPRILSIRSCVSKQNFVHVAVEDTGTGIDPSNYNHIFNPMFTTKERGMGIGLSICRSIIESHNGRIWVTSGIDKGSIFQFELPILDVGPQPQITGADLSEVADKLIARYVNQYHAALNPIADIAAGMPPNPGRKRS